VTPIDCHKEPGVFKTSDDVLTDPPSETPGLDPPLYLTATTVVLVLLPKRNSAKTLSETHSAKERLDSHISTQSPCAFRQNTKNIAWETHSALPVSSEISDFTPCAHAQNGILHIKYAEKTDD